MEKRIPRIAIIEHNTLAAIGLKTLLQNIMPVMSIDIFYSFGELEMTETDAYFHFFVSMTIVIDHRQFFMAHQRKTIVLTTSANPKVHLSDFHCLCINQPEKQLIKSILELEQMAHGHGQNLPPASKRAQEKILSDREVEVMSLIVKGYINKEIADKLNIGLSTVITHRHNIMEKLNAKSVSSLTIYAVMHGYVDIDKI